METIEMLKKISEQLTHIEKMLSNLPELIAVVALREKEYYDKSNAIGRNYFSALEIAKPEQR
jgi:hypothetical protein